MNKLKIDLISKITRFINETDVETLSYIPLFIGFVFMLLLIISQDPTRKTFTSGALIVAMLVAWGFSGFFTAIKGEVALVRWMRKWDARIYGALMALICWGGAIYTLISLIKGITR